MSCDASTLMQEAAANGYYGLGDRDLKIATLQLICSLSTSGSSGGSCLSRSVGPPVTAPAVGCPVAINITDTGAWYWYDTGASAWIQFA